MNPTIKIYDSQPYQTEFQAAVISCEPVPEPVKETISPAEASAARQLYHIVLDRTLFFPEEGGQNADCGTLNTHPVLDVQIKQNIIYHTTDVPFIPGSCVAGMIDWPTRYSNMQQHSGEHIMSGLIHSRFGYDNVGFHLGTQNVTLDFNGFLTGEQLNLIETLANEAIYKNMEIIAEYPAKENLKTLTYRSKIEIDGPVRIVTIPGYDICACCAPHVKRTGEIGMIKIVDAVKYKGGIRISILCGSRALSDYRRKQEQQKAISVLLSAKEDSVSQAVAKLKDDNYSLKGKIMELQNLLIEQKVSRLPQTADSLYLFEDILDVPVHKKYVNLLTEKSDGICGVFSGSDDGGYRYIIASPSKDVRAVNHLLKEAFQAKGGGSFEMVQGSLHAAQNEILKVLRQIKE